MSVNYAKLFSTFQEFPDPVEATVKGEIPQWAKGTLLRNGPGIYEFGPDKYNHWFDGLAIMQRFHIENGKVFYSSKYLRSETFQKNMAAQRIVIGEFGTLAFPDPCKSIFQRYFSYFFPGKPTDNDVVNFVQCGDEVYALTELTLMNKVDVKTLDTINQVNFHKYVATNHATAHPHCDRQGNIYNMGSSYSNYNIIMTPNPLNEKEKNEQTCSNAFEKSKIVAKIPIQSSYSYYHSFGMSKNYIIFPEMPLHFIPWKLMTATVLRNPVSYCLDWRKDEKTVFHLVTIADGENLPLKYTADGFFTFHHANTYEKDDCVVVDVVAYLDGSLVQRLNLDNLRQGLLLKNEQNYGKLWRFILPLKIPTGAKPGDNLLAKKAFKTNATAVLQEDGSIHCSHQLLLDKFIEFPRINYEKCNALPYQFCYSTGISDSGKFMFNELCKIDVQSGNVKTWSCEHPAQFVGEPVFIKRPGSTEEDDGIVLSPVTDIANEDKNFLLVLNAKTFEEVARAEINRLFPFGFHGHFVN